MTKLIDFVKEPRRLINYVLYHTAALWPDKPYLSLRFYSRFGYWIDWNAPQGFNEKCQWMKLYYRRPDYVTMVDKYAVKQYVAEKIGAEHVVDCYGAWEHFDDIDFDKLPEQFVLKVTHDSGGFVVCKDKASFDKAAAKQKMELALKKNYFIYTREWPYKMVPRRIIAERYIDSLGKPESVEYKLTCMDGEVRVITVCGGIAHAAFELRSNDHFDKDWNRQNWYASYKPKGGEIPKPKEMDEIIRLSEILSKGIPQVRVDWYVHQGQIYFGEMTFYTWAGFAEFNPWEWNYKLGSWIKLPEKFEAGRPGGVIFELYPATKIAA